MSYSRSPAIARREEPELVRLLSGGMHVWTEPTEEEAQLRAYRFRQARSIILRNHTEFRKLSTVIGGYRFEVHGCDVRAIPVGLSKSSTSQPSSIRSVEASSNTPTWSALPTIHQPTSVEKVIQAWIDEGSAAGCLKITSCRFSNIELRQLETWAGHMVPSLVVNVSEGDVMIEAVTG